MQFSHFISGFWENRFVNKNHFQRTNYAPRLITKVTSPKKSGNQNIWRHLITSVLQKRNKNCLVAVQVFSILGSCVFLYVFDTVYVIIVMFKRENKPNRNCN